MTYIISILHHAQQFNNINMVELGHYGCFLKKFHSVLRIRIVLKLLQSYIFFLTSIYPDSFINTPKLSRSKMLGDSTQRINSLSRYRNAMQSNCNYYTSPPPPPQKKIKIKIINHILYLTGNYTKWKYTLTKMRVWLKTDEKYHKNEPLIDINTV